MIVFSKIINNEPMVFVRSFSSSKISCMNDHVKPCIRKHCLFHNILHAGTNSALELAESFATENWPLVVSSIVHQSDSGIKWRKKFAMLTFVCNSYAEVQKIRFLDSRLKQTYFFKAVFCNLVYRLSFAQLQFSQHNLYKIRRRKRRKRCTLYAANFGGND